MAPVAGYFWPDGVSRGMTIADFVAAYATFGYSVCEEGSLEAGFEKIALYSRGDYVDHAARQLPNGRWTSKLGLDGEDIEHDSVEVVAGGVYGTQITYMNRSRPG
jgi:hypothetical protein